MNKLASLLLALLLCGVADPAGAQPSALRFTPPAGDTSLQDFADRLGNTPQERQQLGEAFATVKVELFEQPNAARGWKNNVAGAYTFFVSSISTVLTGQAPDPAAQDALFARLGTALAPDLAGVPDRDKAELYSTLIGGASLPLLLFIDGSEKKNPAQIEQARTLAAQYSREIMKMEPEEVLQLLQPASADGAVAPTTAPSAAAATSGLDGRYECQMAQLSHAAGANFGFQYQPTGMWFAIQGGRYTSSSAGGTVQANGDVVSFHGGSYGGWRGARRGNAIVFRKNQGDPAPGESIRVGDLRCGRRSG